MVNCTMHQSTCSTGTGHIEPAVNWYNVKKKSIKIVLYIIFLRNFKGRYNFNINKHL